MLSDFKQAIDRGRGAGATAVNEGSKKAAKFPKHNYVQEEHYEKILGGQLAESNVGGGSSSSREDEPRIRGGASQHLQAEEEKKEDLMVAGHAPFKSDDESNQSDQASNHSSS